MLETRRNNILVEPIEEDHANGFFIPPLFRQGVDTVKLGRVESCGPDTPVVPGDVVVFGKWDGAEIEYDYKRLLLIKPRSIFAIK